MILFHHGVSREFDGPGERLVFYFKGCNFHCDWCASPESISPEPELLYYPERNQDRTGRSCSRKACSPDGILNREFCRNCPTRSCIEIWHNPAFELAGTFVTPDDILRMTEKYSGLIDGVTFGGGEPTLQGEDLLTCAESLRDRSIHTAMESNASTPFYKKMVGNVSLLYSDLKTLDPQIARSRMKSDLSLVRENLLFAAEYQNHFILRIPVIRGVNDSPEKQDELISFCGAMQQVRPDGVLKVELLRQHHLGEPKYKALNQPYLLQGTPETEHSAVEEFAEKLKRAGIRTAVFA